MSIYIKTKNNRKLKFLTSDEVFSKHTRSKKFREGYHEENARLALVKQVKELRKGEKITQKELARRAKMPQSAIARIEKGEKGFTIGTISRIAEVFGKEIKLI